MAEEGKLTLKVSYQEEVRRLRDWPGEQEPSLQSLQDAACGLFELSGTYVLQYQDSEGNLVALTSENLAEAMEMAYQTGLLRVTLTALTQPEEAAITKEEELPPVAESVTDSLHASDVSDSTATRAEPTAPGAATGGWSGFKQQVVNDFQSNYRDMQGAFQTSGTQHPALNVAGQVAGFTAGVCASARLIPLHGTKLAARGVAAAANIPVSEAMPEPGPTPTQLESGNDIQHFKHQVLQDFQMGRQEIQTAFGYFTGGPSADSAEASASEPPRLGKDVIPAVASTVAGLTIASTLVPLRAARLVVASLTARRDEAPPAPGSEPLATPPAPQ